MAVSASLSAQKSASITVHANQGKEIIPKEIYGQFAEHLGSCIYGGLWVGENSDITGWTVSVPKKTARRW